MANFAFFRKFAPYVSLCPLGCPNVRHSEDGTMLSPLPRECALFGKEPLGCHSKASRYRLEDLLPGAVVPP